MNELVSMPMILITMIARTKINVILNRLSKKVVSERSTLRLIKMARNKLCNLLIMKRPATNTAIAARMRRPSVTPVSVRRENTSFHSTSLMFCWSFSGVRVDKESGSAENFFVTRASESATADCDCNNIVDKVIFVYY